MSRIRFFVTPDRGKQKIGSIYKNLPRQVKRFLLKSHPLWYPLMLIKATTSNVIIIFLTWHIIFIFISFNRSNKSKLLELFLNVIRQFVDVLCSFKYYLIIVNPWNEVYFCSKRIILESFFVNLDLYNIDNS